MEKLDLRRKNSKQNIYKTIWGLYSFEWAQNNITLCQQLCTNSQWSLSFQGKENHTNSKNWQNNPMASFHGQNYFGLVS